MAASVELIAYASRLGGDLARLRDILAGPLADLFAGVHILPFYTAGPRLQAAWTQRR